MSPCALTPPQPALIIAASNATTANLRPIPEARSVIRMRLVVLIAAAVAANQAFPSSPRGRRAEPPPSARAARPASCIPIDFDGIAERPLERHLNLYHAGGRTVGPRSSGPGSPGVGAASAGGAGGGVPAGGSTSPQLVRARISALVAGGTKSLPSRICQPPP